MRRTSSSMSPFLAGGVGAMCPLSADLVGLVTT